MIRPPMTAEPMTTRARRRMTGLLFGLGAVAQVAAAQTNFAPIVAGCEPDYPPYCIITKDHHADGFSVELLRAALQAMDRTVVFTTGQWSRLKQDLTDGRLQVLPLVARTPAREALFDFTFPYLTMHGALVVRRDTTNIYGLADLRGKRAAVLQDDMVEEYLRRAKVGALIVPLPSFETALRELAAGAHDAVVIQKLLAYQLFQQAGLTNLVVVGPPLQDFVQDFCFAVHKGDRALLATLNEGLAIVMANGTLRTLYTKWFAPIEAASRTRQRMVVGGDDNYPPFEFLDRNGQPAGLSVDLTRAIAEELGLTVVFHLAPWETVRRGLQNGSVDVLQHMFYSAARDAQVDFSQPYNMVQHVIVTRRDAPPLTTMKDLAGKTILVQAGDIMHDLALSQGYEKQLVPVASQEEALRRLAAGQGDAALVTKIPALYWINRQGWRNLAVAQQPVLTTEACYATLHNNQALLDDLAAGLAALKSTGKFRALHTKWLSPYEATGLGVWTVVRYVALVALPLLLLLLGSHAWSRALQRRVSSRTQELSFKSALLEAQAEATIDGILVVDNGGRVLACNRRFTQMWQIPPDEKAAPAHASVLACLRAQLADPARLMAKLNDPQRLGDERGCDEIILKDGRVFEGYSAPLARPNEICHGRVWFFHDITTRKREELQRELAARVLAILNRDGTTDQLVAEILPLIKTGTGIAAVGIRLRDGDDFPYYQTSVFPPDFVAAERSLCARTAADAVLRDARGAPVMECLCGAVVTGRRLPDPVCGSPHGSVWINSTTALQHAAAHATRDDAAQSPPRLRTCCHRAGFESVALIPLRSGAEILGLLQFADHRAGVFTLALIQFLEGLGASIGIALARQQATTIAREREEHFQQLVQLAPLPLCFLSKDQNMGFFNQRFSTVFGYSRADLPSLQAWWQRAYPDEHYRQQVMRTWEAAVATATRTGADIEAREYDITCNDGTVRAAIVAGIIIGDSVLVSFTDVTERKHTEAATRAAHAETQRLLVEAEQARRILLSMMEDQQRAAEEQADLQAQLQQAQRMESIGRLAGGIAHDFNNLLQAITGFTDLLLERTAPADDRGDDLREIQHAAARATDLTRQLLAFGRKQLIEPRVLDINKTIADMTKMLGRLLGEDIHLDTIYTPDLARIHADPGQVEQIVMNLAVNARDAMPEGGRLTISTAKVTLRKMDVAQIAEAHPGTFVCLAVSDTGLGMGPDVMPHIFEPFFTTKGLGRGTGLGLSVIYGIAKQNNGWVTAYSQVGQGSTLKVYLPAYVSEQDHAIPPAADDNHLATELRGHGEHILLVEDAAGVRKLATTVLQAAGYIITACATGQQALTAFQCADAHFDALFSDVVLPDHDGLKLAEELCAQVPTLPVLLCSGYADERARWASIEQRGFRFLQKPYPTTTLLRELRQMLSAPRDLSK